MPSDFSFTGPFSAITSYLSEFHSTENRSRVHLVRGIASGIALIILPMIAWAILPNAYTFSTTSNFSKSYEQSPRSFNLFKFVTGLHSWNFFLLICGVPTFITGLTFIFLPESPKFLMASGKSAEALEVFKVVYYANTGKSANTFPVRSLLLTADLSNTNLLIS